MYEEELKSANSLKDKLEKLRGYLWHHKESWKNNQFKKWIGKRRILERSEKSPNSSAGNKETRILGWPVWWTFWKTKKS